MAEKKLRKRTTKARCLKPKFDQETGLITVVVVAERFREKEDGKIVRRCLGTQVLMVVCANEKAYSLTLKTGFAHFWSRKRKAIWKKGEKSGNFMPVAEIRVDCDGDSLLYVIDKSRLDLYFRACHTSYYTCFFRSVIGDQDYQLRAGTPEALEATTYQVHDSLFRLNGKDTICVDA